MASGAAREVDSQGAAADRTGKGSRDGIAAPSAAQVKVCQVNSGDQPDQIADHSAQDRQDAICQFRPNHSALPRGERTVHGACPGIQGKFQWPAGIRVYGGNAQEQGDEKHPARQA